jgi:7-cyano-7-deazaguanine synthase in queuosine biosynthesis
MRELIRRDCGEERCFQIISSFYGAVRLVFKEDWEGHTPLMWIDMAGTWDLAGKIGGDTGL